MRRLLIGARRNTQMVGEFFSDASRVFNHKLQELPVYVFKAFLCQARGQILNDLCNLGS